MRNRDCPCHGCEDRTPRCKTECSLYKEWRAECAEHRARIDAERAKYKEMEYYRVQSIFHNRRDKPPMR